MPYYLLSTITVLVDGAGGKDYNRVVRGGGILSVGA
jgi:hypothetical protein